jgi:hypothetical protein
MTVYENKLVILKESIVETTAANSFARPSIKMTTTIASKEYVFYCVLGDLISNLKNCEPGQESVSGQVYVFVQIANTFQPIELSNFNTIVANGVEVFKNSRITIDNTYNVENKYGLPIQDIFDEVGVINASIAGLFPPNITLGDLTTEKELDYWLNSFNGPLRIGYDLLPLPLNINTKLQYSIKRRLLAHVQV